SRAAGRVRRDRSGFQDRAGLEPPSRQRAPHRRRPRHGRGAGDEAPNRRARLTGRVCLRTPGPLRTRYPRRTLTRCQRQGVSKEAVVSFPFHPRRNPSRRLTRRRVFPCFGALSLMLGLVVSLSGVAHSPAHAATLLAGSPFDASNGVADASAGAIHPDLPSGQQDDSYAGGVKEDTVCPAVGTGSIPPKADLTGVYVAVGNATDGSGDHFLYL